MSLRDINKRYIDNVLEYFIKEMYSWRYFEQKSDREKYGKIDIESMLNKRLEDLNKKDFVIDWKVNVNKKNIVKAYTYPSFFSGSWGEMITIIFDDDQVMINSICNPDAQSSMSSMGRNR